MNVKELLEQLAQIPGHYDVAVPMLELADGRVDSEALVVATEAKIISGSHVFVVIR